jgi:hypothetical protein
MRGEPKRERLVTIVIPFLNEAGSLRELASMVERSVEGFLRRETAMVEAEAAALADFSPYRQTGDA